MHIRVGDMVEVTAGNDRGVRAKVLKIDREAGKLVVEGVNRVFKHMKRSQRNPQGGRLSKEMPIQISNVLLVGPACNAAARTGSRRTADGGKERVCKKCQRGAGVLAPSRSKAKPAAAKS
jgi:large subunit ribosomal protein L24